ncbi:MAG: hypothetical protein K2J10_00995 [Muribaculaceae bacterium]|nr:hypothetical protein [Muribaculaceae bacterium]
MATPTPLEQLVKTAVTPRQVSIGLPTSLSPAERRFPLTPEAAAMLVDRGFTVKMESGASESIHFSDEAYARHGVVVVDRAEALRCDIVVYLPTVSEADARKLKRGALLLGFEHAESRSPGAIRVLLQRSVTAIALDKISDSSGNHPFADILREIDGRAAVAIASSLLADAIHGKGILLGGIAGVVPCELTLIGADLAALAAARSAIGLGATVRLFDNDIYRLRDLEAAVGPGVIASALHPRVLHSALRTADIVIGCSLRRPVEISSEEVGDMKRGVITFDLNHAQSPMFPSMPTVDLALASPCDNAPESGQRVCYINAGSAVPRTAAMALSNTLLTMFEDIVACRTALDAIKINPGLRGAAYTFLGKPVSAEVASLLGMRVVDINLLLQCS